MFIMILQCITFTLESYQYGNPEYSVCWKDMTQGTNGIREQLLKTSKIEQMHEMYPLKL